MHTEHRTFSLIFIIKDNQKAIQLALWSTALLDYPKEAFEVIIVDDGSKSPVEKSLDAPDSINLKFLYLERIEGVSCRARARNKGVDLAVNDWLIFIDGDHFVSQDLLSIYNRYFAIKRNRRVLLGSRRHLQDSVWHKADSFLRNGKTPIFEHHEYLQDERLTLTKETKRNFEEFTGRWHLFWSCNFCIEKPLYKDISGFDEAFIPWGLEDVDFGYRLLKHDESFEIIDNYAWHCTPKQQLDKEKYLGWIKNIQYIYLKHLDPRLLQQFEFEDIFFYGAGLAPQHAPLSWIESYLNFETKITYYSQL